MKLITKIKDLEIDLPVLNKFLLCLPLRPGLIACGFLQLIANVLISVFACVDFAEKSPYYHGFALVQMIIIFMALMIYGIVDVLNCGFLVIGAYKRNSNFLEVCYHYQRVKVLTYAGLLLIFFFVSIVIYSQNWFYRNFDPVRNYMLNYNMAFGIIDWILQFYLLLLVRSELIKLEHVVDLSSLYSRLNSQPTLISDDEHKKGSLSDCDHFVC